MALIDDAALEQRCRALVDDLTLPHSCTLQALVANVAEHQRTTIALHAEDLSAAPEVSAMITGTPTGYSIRYHDSGDPWWVMMCVGHELGHILGGHPLMRREAAQGDGLVRDAQAFQRIEQRLPAMHDAFGDWIMFRCDGRGPLEREAELIASLLFQRIEVTRSSSLPFHLLATPGPDPRPGGLLARLRRRHV